ncbi:efflux RND transporter periplasmic adaptor subunit [Paenibacillus sp. GCM10012307]|uniref:Efflux RND transporter periplasmic adaptor subunit n=1 Tax=Paenibacillus roseus TaxID=2798579 RepID=A0A934J763_9BACL|nr:efflux RND transporter periplasmic adaptor subunit [Paenibacillus roseus]MBJ6362883.1 efflux RND transporter periplasmic adaptor subunit [Paenibacillus roseus]
MYLKWKAGSWLKLWTVRAPRRLVALAMLVALTGCSFTTATPEAELLELVEPPSISKKPEYTAVKATIEITAKATGKLMSEKKESLQFSVDSGQIAEILVAVGEKVSKGQVIAKLNTATLEMQIKRKDIEVRQAELNMIEKLRDDNRTERQNELDALSFELLKSEYNDLKAQLEASMLKAPFDGTLESFSKAVGESIKAFEAVAVVADLNKLAVAVRFSSSDLETIAPGMDAIVNINTAGSYSGKVLRMPIGSSNDEDSLDQYVLIKLNELPSNVRAGTPLSAAVVTERKENAILIPPAALRNVAASGRNYVQVVDGEGNKREVDVEVGLTTATEIEILKGLEPGQKVIGK